ncbi:AAA domain-containing protein [Acetoanaerobium sticklandii]|uniref:AAA domain-containing protein n=1 Tax=Acetoanaerobium sticklandii TaxID=1511 RepID=UPI003A8D0810
MDVKKILEYFIDYENYNLLNSITTVSKKNDFDELKLKDIKLIINNVIAQKYNSALDIIDYRFKRLGENGEEIKKELKTLCIESMELNDSEIETRLNMIFEQLFQNLNETTESQKWAIKNELIRKEFYIYYPMYWVEKSYMPLCAFNCTVNSGELNINSYAVTEALLNIFMKKQYAFDEYFSNRKEKENFYSSLTSFDNNDIFSLVDVITETVINKIDFIKKDLVSKRQKFFMISLSDNTQSYSAPFKEELVLTNHLLNKSRSELLESYLLCGESVEYNEKINNITHFGSYPFGINYNENELPTYTVNKKQWEIMNLYNDVKLQSVTGPPGTGKTTVLKEIIADMFVKKTNALLKNWDERWIENNDGTYRSPFEGNNNFSMVITSTNNDAVNNIGEELINEISLFNISNLKSLEYTFCAKMGNKDNTDQFISDSFLPLIQNLEDAHEVIDEESLRVEFKETYSLLEYFNQLLSNLDQSIKFVESHHGVSVQYLESAAVLENYISAFKECNNQIDQLQIKIDNLNKEKKDFEEKIIVSNKEVSSIKRRLNDQVNLLKNIEDKTKWFLVGRFIEIFIEKKRKIYQDNNELISNELIETIELLTHYKSNLCELETDLKNTMKTKFDFEVKLEKIDQAMKSLKKYQLEHEKLQIFMEKQELQEDLIQDRYKLCNCEKITFFRTKLFKLSLLLHEVYIIKHRKEILSSLNEIYKPGKNLFSTCYRSTYLYNEETTNKIRNLWEVFCLCYPVISTTLHSFERSKFHMISQLFDLVMVDESGQVLPHYLVSPIFRSKKALIVGDAFQLQPVRKQKYPQIFEKHERLSNIGKHLDLDSQSAQNLADSNTKYFDTLDGKKIGLMLEEHRRCEENIAIFSNKYVYNNKMILKTKNKLNEDKFLGNNLVFIDVRGYKEKDNKNYAEAEVIKNIIKSIRERDVISEIGVITPYSNHQHLLKKSVKDVNTECGTVHKFQGKGKDIIIISLVVSSIDDQRGLSFIASEANFLNVALTRAKSQVILVGNYDILAKGNTVLKKLNNVIKTVGAVYSFYDDEIDMDDKYAKIVKEFITAGTPKDDNYTKLFSIYERHRGILTDDSHYLFLMNLFENAKSIEICTPWVNTIVVKPSFLSKLEEFIRNGNRYKITFGYNKTKYSLSSSSEIKEIIAKDSAFKYDEEKEVDMILNLKNLLGDSLIYNPPLHAKVLIVNEEYLVIGSHNWLSKQGNSKREVSCIVKNRSMAQFIREDIYKIKE